MVGTKYASEKRIFTDPKSGAQITQLTNQGINYHFYFTENSFDLDGKTIYFLSNLQIPAKRCTHSEINSAAIPM